MSFLKPLLKNPVASCRLVNSRTGRIVADRLLTAFDSTTRRTGLLRHDSLPDGGAMILAPSNAIHTCFMRFDIDVALTTKDGRVIKIRRALPPWRLTGALRAYAVIEFRAGTLMRTDTVVGDFLVITV